MKTRNWIGWIAAAAMTVSCVRAQTPGPAAPGAPVQAQSEIPANMSPGAAEVIRLATSGLGDDVVLAYIQNSQAPFSLTADNVLYLKDIGLSSQVTSAMLNHDNALRGQSQQYAPAPVQQVAPAQGTWGPAATTAPPPGAVAPAPATGPAPSYVTAPPPDVSYFYDDLSPYGSWVYLEGYGWCWQPRAVVLTPGWRPYCDDGYWVYSDAGWFWQSTYSWGWAPFHYGRWYMHPHNGWVWFPDRVWGPAWVTWRTGGNNCGWAPLPPHAEFDVHLGWRFNGVAVGANFGFNLGANAFAFVSFGNFGNHDLHHYALPPAQATTVYKQTTIVNNYVVKNNVVVHQGIPVERVTAASHVAVPRATVRDWKAAPDHMPVRSSTVVYRPQLKQSAQPTHMVAQKVDEHHPVIQHAPVVPTRTETRTMTGGSAPARGAASSRTIMQSPKYAPWSGGSRGASAPRREETPHTYQPAPAEPSSPAAPRSPNEFKHNNRHGPGDRSEATPPAMTHSSFASKAPSAVARSGSEPRTVSLRPARGSEETAHARAQSSFTQSHADLSPASGRSGESRSRGRE